MKIVKALIGSGIVIMSLGMVFFLQGQEKIGPESSFMYSNPDWIENGWQIALFGLMIITIGIGISIKDKKLKR